MRSPLSIYPAPGETLTFYFEVNIVANLIQNSTHKLADWLSFNLLKLLLPAVSQRSLKSLQKDTQNPASVQQKVLQTILKRQQETDYGKKYNFANLHSGDEFRKAHPLTTYEDYRSIIENIANTGNFSQLVAEPIILFQETAGTTGQTKLIPRTKSLFDTYQKSFQAVAALTERYAWKNQTNSPSGLGLAFANAQPLKHTPSGIPKGTGTSGGIRQSKLTQNLIKLKFSSPPSLFLISNYTSAYYCHLLFGLLETNLSYISANFASNVLQALQILEEYWSQIVDDIQSGQINPNLDIDDLIRQELQALLQPNPERAQTLKDKFEQGFAGIIPKIWPQLSHIQCITTGAMQIYKERLQFYTGDLPIFSHGYGASESWIGVNLQPERENPAYAIAPHAAFFEFIPLDRGEVDNPSTVDLMSLSVGERYEIVVTTLAGLYRYRLGDIVQCVGYYNRTPIVEFLYRQGSLLNLYNEKVSEQTIFSALTQAIPCLGENAKLIDYTTQMQFSSQPWCYIIYAEVDSPGEISSHLSQCQNQIECSIREVNKSYQKLREANRIDLPKVKLVQRGSFDLLKSQFLKRGSSENQFKMPRLLKNPDMVNLLEDRVVCEV